MTTKTTADDVRTGVRKSYTEVANKAAEGGGCCGGSTGCCAVPVSASGSASSQMGYTDEELALLPEGANLGLGCGNPQAIAALKPGEVVVDLGSGAGIDCFLASQRVGPTGKVIGVDMTPDMVSSARRHARNNYFENVEFRLGEIESLPIADGVADVIMSNCVINLSPEKERVFAEAHRILKSGGRLAISDVVATGHIPDSVRNDPAMISGCIAGAAPVAEIERMLRDAGFTRIDVDVKAESRDFIKDWAPGSKIEDFVASATIQAVKG